MINLFDMIKTLRLKVNHMSKISPFSIITNKIICEVISTIDKKKKSQFQHIFLLSLTNQWTSIQSISSLSHSFLPFDISKKIAYMRARVRHK